MADMEIRPTVSAPGTAARPAPQKPKQKRLDDDLLAALKRVAKSRGGIQPGVPFH